MGVGCVRNAKVSLCQLDLLASERSLRRGNLILLNVLLQDLELLDNAGIDSHN